MQRPPLLERTSDPGGEDGVHGVRAKVGVKERLEEAQVRLFARHIQIRCRFGKISQDRHFVLGCVGLCGAVRADEIRDVNEERAPGGSDLG
jgi:hypothetical protein